MKRVACLVAVFAALSPFAALAAPPGPPPSVIPDQTTPATLGETASSSKGVRFYSINDLPLGIREEEAKTHRNFVAKGYVEMPDEQVSWLDAMPKAAKPLSDQKGQVKVKLADLEKTPFHSLRFLGAVREGPPRSLSRVFLFPNGAVVLLREWDYLAEGGGIMIPKERINEQVNGTPAVLGIAQAPGGKAISELSWVTENKSYSLIVAGNVRRNGQYKKVMELANSIKD